MKIQRYTAASMRVALAQVRAEQGPDAVILSSRRIEEGIEVIAAVDYDESLMPDMLRPRVPPPEAPPAAPAPQAPAPPLAPAMKATQPLVPAPQVTQPPVAPAAATPPAVVARVAVRAATPPVLMAPVAQPRVEDSVVGAMHRELQDMRRLLESEIKNMTWNDKRLREPLKVRVLEELTALDIAPDVAVTLSELMPRHPQLANPSHLPLALIAKSLPVIEDQTCFSGGILALVGPTGAGKTTTIAKLAARWCLRHGSDAVALVSTDSYRIGAREQLLTFARILGAPMHCANDGVELVRLLDRLTSKKLILIDTAGMGPRDARLAEQLAALRRVAARVRVMLALPAQGEGNALEEIVGAYAAVSPASCVLTKVDEAASLGAALSTAIRHRLPIAYLCNGQRVPEDLHSAHHKRVWLAQAAASLKKHAKPRRDEGYMARNFGRVQAHA